MTTPPLLGNTDFNRGNVVAGIRGSAAPGAVAAEHKSTK
jgi:hypothetical protein